MIRANSQSPYRSSQIKGRLSERVHAFEEKSREEHRIVNTQGTIFNRFVGAGGFSMGFLESRKQSANSKFNKMGTLFVYQDEPRVGVDNFISKGVRDEPTSFFSGRRLSLMGRERDARLGRGNL